MCSRNLKVLLHINFFYRWGFLDKCGDFHGEFEWGRRKGICGHEHDLPFEWGSGKEISKRLMVTTP